MLNKLFGGKKSKDGFYVQLDEASEAKSNNSSNGKKAVTNVVEKPKAEAVVVDRKKSESAQVKAVVEETKNAVVETTKSAAKTSKKKTSGKSKSKADTAPVASVSKKVPEYEPPFWVKAMNANTSNGNGNGKVASVESFADNNLMPLPNRSRRRPGPSLSPFMDMARGVKNSSSRI
jgi:archaellum component FlaD/FlaE